MWRGWNPAHFVVEQEEVLISYATVIETTLDHAGETYKTLGLSSVFTYPPFRGEGHARGVVDPGKAHEARPAPCHSPTCLE